MLLVPCSWALGSPRWLLGTPEDVGLPSCLCLCPGQGTLTCQRDNDRSSLNFPWERGADEWIPQLPCTLHGSVLRCILHSFSGAPQHSELHFPTLLTHSFTIPFLAYFPSLSHTHIPLLYFLGRIFKYTNLHQNLCLRLYLARTLSCLSQRTV